MIVGRNRLCINFMVLALVTSWALSDISNAQITTASYAEDVLFRASFEAAPVVRLSQSTLDFGSQLVGVPSTRQIIVTNVGNLDLYKRGWTAQDPFRVRQDDCPSVLPAGASCSATLEFIPAAPVFSTATLSIETGSEQFANHVQLEGYGLQNPDVMKLPVSNAIGLMHSIRNDLRSTAESESNLYAIENSDIDPLEILTGAGAPVDYVNFSVEEVWIFKENLILLHVVVDASDIALLIHPNSNIAYNVTDALPPTQILPPEDDSNPLHPNPAVWQIQPFIVGDRFFYYKRRSGNQRDLAVLDLRPDENGALSFRILQANSIDEIGRFFPNEENSLILYQDWNQIRTRIVRLSDGALFNIGEVISDVTVEGIFLGLDHELYVITGSCEVFRIEMGSSEEPTASPISAFNSSETTCPTDLHNRYRRVVGGKLIFQELNQLIEIDVQTGRFIEHPALAVSGLTFEKVLVTSNYFWGFGIDPSGQSALIRYNPVDKSIDLLEFPPNLDVYDISLLGTDRVFFAAQDIRDFSNVVGEAALDGELTTIEIYENAPDGAIIVQPITPGDFVTVDGRASEWGPEEVIVDSPLDSGRPGHDLKNYSEISSSDRYFGLVQFHDDPDWSGPVVVEIPPFLIRAGASGFQIENTETGNTRDATEIGGRYSLGTALEFSVPITVVNTSTREVREVRKYSIDQKSGEEVLEDTTLPR